MSGTLHVTSVQVLGQKYGPDLVILKLEGLTPAMPDVENEVYANIRTAAGTGAEWAKTNFPGVPCEILPSRI